MIKVNKKNLKGKWYKYPADKDIELFIVPFPYTKSLFDIMGATKDVKENQAAQARTMFVACITDWRGIVDEKNEPLKCNKSNKDLIFEEAYNLVIWVLETAASNDNKVIKQVKN